MKTFYITESLKMGMDRKYFKVYYAHKGLWARLGRFDIYNAIVESMAFSADACEANLVVYLKVKSELKKYKLVRVVRLTKEGEYETGERVSKSE